MASWRLHGCAWAWTTSNHTRSACQAQSRLRRPRTHLPTHTPAHAHARPRATPFHAHTRKSAYHLARAHAYSATNRRPRPAPEVPHVPPHGEVGSFSARVCARAWGVDEASVWPGRGGWVCCSWVWPWVCTAPHLFLDALFAFPSIPCLYLCLCRCVCPWAGGVVWAAPSNTAYHAKQSRVVRASMP